MDQKKGLEKRPRSSKSFQVINSSSPENNNSKSSRSLSESKRYSNSKYLNSSNKNNDSNNEENVDKIPNNKQYNRRDSFSSEETDENNSDYDVHKRKIKQTGKMLPKQEKRRKKAPQRRLHNQREEKCISSSRNLYEENLDEDRTSLKSHRNLQTFNKKDCKRLKSKSRSLREEAKNEDREVPIATILRQNEENVRMQYQEPKPYPQLTTDTIYVEGRNRFSAVKIPAEHITGGITGGITEGITSRGRRGPDAGEPAIHPIKIAIFAQKAWKNAGFIYQGLLAGIAFMHFILIQTYFKSTNQSIEDYSVIAEIYANVFYFFIVMSIISAFDRFDLAHFDVEHFRELYNNYAKAIIVIPLYIGVFCLHQATLKVYDKLVLLDYTKNTTSYLNDNGSRIISDEELENWKAITLTKDGMVILAWLLVSFGPQSDLLLTHLQSLEKYHDSDYY